jgi:hypothetical protein
MTYLFTSRPALLALILLLIIGQSRVALPNPPPGLSSGVELTRYRELNPLHIEVETAADGRTRIGSARMRTPASVADLWRVLTDVLAIRSSCRA